MIESNIRILHDSRNGIDPVNYKFVIIFNKTITTIEDTSSLTIVKEFKHRDLTSILHYASNKYNSILVKCPFCDLKRRLKALSDNFYEVELMARTEDLEKHDTVEFVIKSVNLNLDEDFDFDIKIV